MQGLINVWINWEQKNIPEVSSVSANKSALKVEILALQHKKREK